MSVNEYVMASVAAGTPGVKPDFPSPLELWARMDEWAGTAFPSPSASPYPGAVRRGRRKLQGEEAAATHFAHDVSEPSVALDRFTAYMLGTDRLPQRRMQQLEAKLSARPQALAGRRVLVLGELRPHTVRWANATAAQLGLHQGWSAGFLFENLAPAARQLGISIDLLKFHEPPRSTGAKASGRVDPKVRKVDSSRWTGGLFDRVLNGPASLFKSCCDPAGKPGCVEAQAARLAELIRGERLRYHAVVTWRGECVLLADGLSRELGLGSRYLGRHAVSEANKLQINQLLWSAGAAGSGPSLRINSLTSAKEAAASSGSPCYPCFLKTSNHVGGSTKMYSSVDAGSGVERKPHGLSTKITTADELLSEARRLLGHHHPTLVLERFHDGGHEVYAEVLMRRGKLLRASLRTAKVYNTPGVTRWEYPAVLSPEQRSSCLRVVEDVVRVIDLQTGIFCVQMMLDPRMGCVFLELNMRPTFRWALHDGGMQLYFTGVWQYQVVALLLALDAPLEVLDEVMDDGRRPPPLQLVADCGGLAGSTHLETMEGIMLAVHAKECNATVTRQSGQLTGAAMGRRD